jgi:hypothetical protein
LPLLVLRKFNTWLLAVVRVVVVILEEVGVRVDSVQLQVSP